MNINIFHRVPLLRLPRLNPVSDTGRQPSANTSLQYQQYAGRSPEEEGLKEQTIHEAIKKQEDKQAVNDLIKKSNRCIVSISSLFPWDLFPTTIDVEESRVVFTCRQFLSSQTYGVDIKDISNVFIQTSLFYAALEVVSRTFTHNNETVAHLNPAAAARVQMIIEGLRTLAEHDIDTSDYEIDELTAKIAEFHTHKTH